SSAQFFSDADLDFRALFGNTPFGAANGGGMTRELDLTEKLDILMTLAGEDREGPPQSPKALPPRLRHAGDAGALRPLNIRVLKGRGQTMRLLRILMTNACALNCHYCPMRRDRDMRRTLLKPEELGRLRSGERRVGK